VCKLICALVTLSNADVFCSSSEPAVLICTGVWGLLSLIALIAWLRWAGVHSSARDNPTINPPELLRGIDGEQRSPGSVASNGGLAEEP
jgi:hypothetical protein